MRRHFICYSRVDGEEFAIWLRDELEGGFPPIRVWRDRDDVSPGEHWMATTEDAIRGCLSLLFVMTTDSVRDESECTEEWSLARGLRKPILPLRFDLEAEAPYRLRSRQHIDFAQDCRQALALLRKRLRELESPEEELRLLTSQLPELVRDLRTLDLAKRASAERIIDDTQRRIADLAREVEPTANEIGSVGVAATIERRPSTVSVQRPVTIRRPVTIIGRVPDPGADLFQDRIEATELLEDYIRDDAVQLVVVVGPHGVGKSSMVGRLLGSLLEDGDKNPAPAPFDIDGVVYLSTREKPAFTTSMLLDRLREVLPAGVSRSLDGWFTSAEGTSLEKLYQLLWAFAESGMHVVLVIDELEAIVHPVTQEITDIELDRILRGLLDRDFPQRRIKVILVTGRPPRSLMTTQADWQRWLHLAEGLPSPYAERFLRQLDPNGELGLKTAPDEQLEMARRHTGGHPGALRALTAVLRLRGTSLPELLEDTAALKDVRAALIGEAFDSLDPLAQRAMQALAVLERPVSSGAIDFVLARWIPMPKAAETLERLHGMGLVHKMQDTERYVLPAEFRPYVLEQVRPGWEEDDSLFTQLNVLERGADFFAAEREGWSDPRRLEDLTPHLMEIDLRRRAGDYDVAAWLLLQIDTRYLLTWGHSQLVLEQHQALEGRVSDPGVTEASLGTIGTAHFRLGQEEQAADYYRRATEAARSNGDPASEKRWLSNLGSAYFELGQIDRARQCYERALDMARKAGDRVEQAKPLVGISLCLGEIGAFERAIDHHAEALEIARDAGDDWVEAEQLANAGYFHTLLGEADRAKSRLEQGLATARHAGHRLVEGHCLVDTADLVIHWERPTPAARIGEAIGLARHGAEIGRQIGSPQLAWASSSLLALAHLYAGAILDARIAIDAACQYSRRRRMHATFALRGLIAVRQGNYRQASEALATARGLVDQALSRQEPSYTAFDAKGLVLAGLVVSGLWLHEERSPERLLHEAASAYAAARAITSARGVTTRVLCLFDQLARENTEWDLSRVRSAAAGTAA